MKRNIILFSIIALFFITLINCNPGTELREELAAINNGNNNSNATGKIKLVLGSGNNGSLSSILTSTKEDILNLFITISALEVHKTSGSDAGWHSLPIEEGSYDLMALDNTAWAELISLSEITPGNYNKLRFNVTDAEVTTESGTYTADIPSGQIKIGLSFVISEDMIVEISMTIDPEKSLKVKTFKNKDPKYTLNPVFKISGITEEEDTD
ncbi:MAG: DUF4382 domain-containing protein [Acidobacteriota bacterium]